MIFQISYLNGLCLFEKSSPNYTAETLALKDIGKEENLTHFIEITKSTCKK